MINRRKFLHDRFSFSLRGMTATASYFITPVVADDRINKAWDKKFRTGAREPDAEQTCESFDCQQAMHGLLDIQARPIDIVGISEELPRLGGHVTK